MNLLSLSVFLKQAHHRGTEARKDGAGSVGAVLGSAPRRSVGLTSLPDSSFSNVPSFLPRTGFDIKASSLLLLPL